VRRTHNLKLFTVGLAVLVAFALSACSMFEAPDDFTEGQKVEYTTLKTLKSAKIFRDFALASAGSVYKNGLMDAETKDKIISVGDKLQLAINHAADALIAYKQSGGLGGDQSLQEKLLVYQSLFNQFMEIVTPYVLDTAGKEVS